MYGSFEMALIKEKVMTLLEETVSKYKDGKCVGFESEAYSCKAKPKITQPARVILGDEVGAIIDMNGDGHIGGDKLLCETGCIAKKKKKQ